MCSRDACSSEVGTKTARSAHARTLLPNCNYRRDLAVALGVVGRTTTSERRGTCALLRHLDVRAHCTAWHAGARKIPKPKSQNPNPKAPRRQDLPQRRSVPTQPVASGAVVGTRLGDEAPVGRRMVHPAKVHQLVDQHVIANRLRHQHQPPVQADVAVTPARTPP